MSKRWFTADTHYFHKKAVEFRGFQSVDQMNDLLISRYCDRVNPEDHVYFIGDITFGKYDESTSILKSPPGIKHLIPGNHDSSKFMRDWEKDGVFVIHDPIHNIKLGGIHTVLCHFPLLVWDRAHYGSYHLHGHSHGNCKYPDPNTRIMDVGVDCHPDFAPFSESTIIKWMANKYYKAYDHHAETIQPE